MINSDIAFSKVQDEKRWVGPESNNHTINISIILIQIIL